jgi:hypothetical protein
MHHCGSGKPHWPAAHHVRSCTAPTVSPWRCVRDGAAAERSAKQRGRGADGWGTNAGVPTTGHERRGGECGNAGQGGGYGVWSYGCGGRWRAGGRAGGDGTTVGTATRMRAREGGCGLRRERRSGGTRARECSRRAERGVPGASLGGTRTPGRGRCGDALQEPKCRTVVDSKCAHGWAGGQRWNALGRARMGGGTAAARTGCANADAGTRSAAGVCSGEITGCDECRRRERGCANADAGAQSAAGGARVESQGAANADGENGGARTASAGSGRLRECARVRPRALPGWTRVDLREGAQ